MKILLVQPPVQDFYDTDVRLQPLGLAYLKASLLKHCPGVEVTLRDYHRTGGRRSISLPQELKYLQDYYPHVDRSPFKTFHQYFHFGWSFEEIEEDIVCYSPDLLGISSLFTPYYREVLEIARRVKKRLSIPVVVGGSHVSAAPEQMLQDPAIDYVIRGEGERPLVELVQTLQAGGSLRSVTNLGYKEEDRLVLNSMEENYPLDELPLPDFSDFKTGDYLFWGKPMTFMVTSRSCPHRCSFCSVHLTFGTRYRRRSLDNILKEIQLRYEQGFRIIDFEDDNLTFFKKDMKELCRRLIERYPKRDLEFVAMNGISYLSLDPELLELMRQAGFTHLNLALVSSDKSVRESTKRPHTIEAYLRVVKRGFELGFKMVSYQILGLPQESLQSMIQTLAFHARLPVLLGASLFYRTPQSPIASGLVLDTRDFFLARLTSMAVETTECKRDDLYSLFIVTRIINFIKGLNPETSCSLNELIQGEPQNPEQALGFRLLKELLMKGELCFETPQGPRLNRRFKIERLQQVFEQASLVSCLNGTTIQLEPHRWGFGVSPVLPAVVRTVEEAACVR